MQRTKAPFRADEVGSLLRPPRIKEARAKLEKGAAILTLEVMKMEQTLRAPYAGVLKKLKCKVGDIVGERVELAEVEPAA